MGSLAQAVPGRSHIQGVQLVQRRVDADTGIMLRPVLVLSLVLLSVAQRRPPPGFEDEDETAGNSVSMETIMLKRAEMGQFPFKRGERPVFNFDQGDEGFIGTIPELIDGLDKIKNVMNQQRKITQAFGEAFDQCEACG